MLDNVWFTYKARINAHHRLEWMEKHSQFLLIWYALLGAVLSVVMIRFPQIIGGNTDIWATILSVALLCVSIIVSNLDFRGRSIAMRKNYLALQRLYSEISLVPSASSDQRKEYIDLLSEVENHKEIDDMASRVAANLTLTTRKPTPIEFRKVRLWKLRRYLFIYFLYLAPLLLAWVNYDCIA
ncbi:SLATT domain-containing protein [Aeromonas rivipollensis]